jgi:hypothetical protein
MKLTDCGKTIAYGRSANHQSASPRGFDRGRMA